MSSASFFVLTALHCLPVREENDVCLILIPSGCLLETEGQISTCPSGNILITRGSYPITLTCSSESSIEFPVLLLKEAFFDALFFSQISDCPLFYDFLSPDSRQPRFFHFDCFLTDMSWTIAQVLFYEAAKTPESLKTVHAAANLLLTNLHEVHRERLLISRSTMMTEHKIGEILTYMYNHYREVTLESIAGAFHYHPAYFSALFKRQAHITFQQQLLKIRLEQAKFLLSGTTMSVQAIMDEVGFGDKSYFHRCFKKECGMTPLAYRRLSK